MKKLTILAIALLISLMSFGQSSTVADFEKTAEGYKLFLYQSVIRVLNKDKNPDFNMLIRDLDHLRFVSTKLDTTGLEAKATFKELDRGVRGEDFIEIMSFDNPGYKCHVYELESSKGKSTWVAVLLMEDRAAVMEMEGSMDLKYIQSLSSLNMDRLQEMLPIKLPADKKEKKDSEN